MKKKKEEKEMKELFSRFEELRKEHGFTIAEVSRLSGVSRPTIHNWKRGEYFPSLENILKISDLFLVDPGFLFSTKITRRTICRRSFTSTSAEQSDTLRIR